MTRRDRPTPPDTLAGDLQLIGQATFREPAGWALLAAYVAGGLLTAAEYGWATAVATGAAVPAVALLLVLAVCAADRRGRR